MHVGAWICINRLGSRTRCCEEDRAVSRLSGSACRLKDEVRRSSLPAAPLHSRYSCSSVGSFVPASEEFVLRILVFIGSEYQDWPAVQWSISTCIFPLKKDSNQN